jgi:glycosyltransferase involved in cell wall biosynthesis
VLLASRAGQLACYDKESFLRILVIGGVSRSLINFRGPLLQAMVAAGHEVHACAGEPMQAAMQQLSAMGVTFHPVALDRRGTSVLGDLHYRRALARIIASLKPDVVLAYTIKPIVYGLPAAAKAGAGTRAAMITGAGAAQPGSTIKEHVVGWISRRLYRRALRHASVALFQNPDDEAMFKQYRLLGDRRVVQIPGSGVDLAVYAPAATVTEPVTFLLIARLLVNKGVREYAAAAEALKQRYGPRVRFLLVGPFEDGDGGISAEELQDWQERGAVAYYGALSDVRSAMGEASVYVLPSYREGTPRTVLEAMAMGRPIVTTDAVGCRETVVAGENGWLVPPRDSKALTEAMACFVEQPALIEQMGQRSRSRAEAVYDVHRVNAMIMEALSVAPQPAGAAHQSTEAEPER